MEEILKIYRTAEVSKRIHDNIRENRCCDFEIAFVDEKGCPISCDAVAVKQVSHDFKFGANCFMVDELETAEKNAKYEESFAKVFNIATLPFYWDSVEPERGKPRFDKDSPRLYRRPAIDKLIEFCKKNNIEPKGHCLNYEPFVPDWAKELDFPFQRNGSLVICRAEEDLPNLQTLYERGIKNGVKDLRIISREEVLEMEPNITENVVAALYAPTGGIVCPFHLNIALAENANVNELRKQIVILSGLYSSEINLSL